MWVYRPIYRPVYIYFGICVRNRIPDIVRIATMGIGTHVCEAILLRYLAKSGRCFACNTAGKSN